MNAQGSIRLSASLTESRFLRFLTFAALYFAQGIPWGFVSEGYVVFLADQGLDNTAVGGAIALAYMPWAFKIIWGPLIDRFPSARWGRRRPYIIGAEFFMGATMLALMAIKPAGGLNIVGAVLFLHNTFAAMQDVAVDALAVDILPEDERGRANSIMWTSKLVGVFVGGTGGLIVGKHLGWPTLFVAIALLIWGVMALVMALRERPERAAIAVADAPRFSVQEVIRSFSFREPLLGVAIAMLTPAGYSLIGTVHTRMLRADLKLSEEAIGLILGAGQGASIPGAIVGGLLADKLGVRKVTGAFMVGVALAQIAFAALPDLWPSFYFLIGWKMAVGFLFNAYSAATLAFFMTLSNPAIGATQFAAYMAATNLTYSATTYFGGVITDRWGIAVTFLIGAALMIVTIGLLPLCDPRKAEARFRPKTPEEAEVPITRLAQKDDVEGAKAG